MKKLPKAWQGLKAEDNKYYLHYEFQWEYFIRPSKCQGLAGPCKRLFKQDLVSVTCGISKRLLARSSKLILLGLSRSIVGKIYQDL